MSQIKVFRYYLIDQIDRKTGEIIYETALMSRKTMLHILNNILSDFDSDFFDVKIIPVNKKEKAYWIKDDLSEEDEFLLDIEENEKEEDYFTQQKYY